MKILWLSRHPITEVQKADLIESIKGSYQNQFSPGEAPSVFEVVEINFTFASEGEAAAKQIQELCRDYQATAVSGVIPAHVAVEAYRSWEYYRTYQGYLPVPKPAFATDGEVRAYEHSHFERF